MEEEAEVAECILNAVYRGDTQALQDHCEGLGEEHRRGLWKHLGDALTSIVAYHLRPFAPETNVPHPNLVRRDAKPPDSYFRGVWSHVSIILAGRLAIIALAPRSSVLRALKDLPAGVGSQPQFSSDTGSFVYLSAMTLAARPESWARALLMDRIAREPLAFYEGDTLLCLGEALLRRNGFDRDPLVSILAKRIREVGVWHVKWAGDFNREVLTEALEWGVGVPAGSYEQSEFTEKLVDALATGFLTRETVIRVALEGLLGVTRPGHAAFWKRILDKASPSLKDWERETPKVVALLEASTDRAVAVGLKGAKQLVQARVLDPAQVVPVLASAISSSIASQSREGILLAAICARQDRTLVGECVPMLLDALTHPRPEIVERAMNWLEKERFWCDDEPLMSLAVEMAGAVPPELADRFQALLRGNTPSPDSPVEAISLKSIRTPSIPGFNKFEAFRTPRD